MILQLSIEESIRRILVTPLGSRVMMPEYGSRLFELIDRPVNDEWILDAVRFSSEAIETNEPRCILQRVKVSTGDVSSFLIEYVEDGTTRAIDLGFGEVYDAAA
jgi:Bacteriophage baseplate protein W